MKIGLYFGSFNPIHIGHLAIANYMVEFTELDQVWFVVSPHNPFKNKSSLLNGYDRLEMVEKAIENDPRFNASNIEFGLPQPSYTVDTLIHLEENFPNYDFSLIMGSDNIQSIHKWKNSEVLLERYPIYVYPRPDFDSSEWENHPTIHITQSPQFEISATFIRNAIADGKNISHYLPPKVWELIDRAGYYSS